MKSLVGNFLFCLLVSFFLFSCSCATPVTTGKDLAIKPPEKIEPPTLADPVVPADPIVPTMPVAPADPIVPAVTESLNLDTVPADAKKAFSHISNVLKSSLNKGEHLFDPDFLKTKTEDSTCTGTVGGDIILRCDVSPGKGSYIVKKQNGNHSLIYEYKDYQPKDSNIIINGELTFVKYTKVHDPDWDMVIGSHMSGGNKGGTSDKLEITGLYNATLEFKHGILIKKEAGNKGVISGFTVSKYIELTYKKNDGTPAEEKINLDCYISNTDTDEVKKEQQEKRVLLGYLFN